MDIQNEIKKRLEEFDTSVEIRNVGSVVKVGDGVAVCDGLSDVGSGEMVKFDNSGVLGMALNLEDAGVGIMILGEYKGIKEGDTVSALNRSLSIKVDEAILGRVVNSLGIPLDGKGEIAFGKSVKEMDLEKIAPSVLDRQAVDRPIQTGIKAIDSMIPIGRGQRELIIGDRQTGKSAVAVDTIINQKGKNVVCIYVAIGQKASKIMQIKETLEKAGAMEYTTIVLAGSADAASLQYMAPYAGCAIGEYFMEKGKDALVIYDDLTKHAWAYRQISLLLKRPPGREAYPGDVFYLHSRLLERASRMHKDLGGGSLTALPIIETQAGDLSAYIPTNVISITDGQIYLETDLFNSGVRPAINPGLSVSRVGGDAQIKAMKKVAGKLRLDLAQFRELEAFAQFGTDLDKETKARLEQGKRLVEVLKQPQYDPVPVEEQVVVFYACVNGFTNIVPVESMLDWENNFRDFMRNSKPAVLEQIGKVGELNDEIVKDIESSIEEFFRINKY